MVPSDIIPRVVSNGDGVTTRWGYTFPIQSSTDADALNEVFGYITDSDGVITLIDANYSVDVSESEFVYPTDEAMEAPSELEPLPVGSTITLIRIESITQLLNLITRGSFSLETAETALDKLTMIAQQLKEHLSRCIAYPIGTEPGSTDIDAATYIALLLAYKTAAAVSAAAALVSENAAAASAEAAAESADEASASAGSISVVRGTFVYADLVAGQLTITHNKNLQDAPYAVLVEIVKDTGERIRPSLTCYQNSVVVNLSPWGAISGTWGYVVF